MSDHKRPEENTPRGTRPAMPPSAKPAMPPRARPASARPAMPPTARPTGDGKPRLTRKDFASDQDVRWCPGCGDYAILATVQRLLPDLNVPRENIVFISGIGCSSRFPYYMNTYGMHSIHGRAPAIATGLKASRPELDVWIITGDGDALSIGGNHLIHILRRNLNVQILLFNNQIYGLTKGQYSPTSEEGKVTKSSPYGSIDHPFNPVALALGADATFVARSMDRDTKHLQAILRRAHDHRGAAFVEIYQNCNIFNDGAFFQFTERDTKPHRALFLEHGQPLIFDEGRKGIRLDGFQPEVIDLTDDRWSVNDCLVYDETNRELAHIMARIFFRPDLPQPFGVFYREERPTYEDLLHQQIKEVTARKGKGDLQALLQSGDTWVIEPEPAEESA
ncbi:2-oxoglutarate ferredoxin oxidoreductase subunit beta [Rhodothermus profundi]|uniref:2-oxoglutarate ferredoxin oxidoreductase subunit beta n=2 Tax=Rhodothermus profundi TaxID=633813 RepID=A0A1M6VUD8_9BACT|nr:2-oxoacid:ferredoxin oxidoreductase subunit beta [Rhodothermus profundi]SHK84936.1 2-oxoglutarate ferredoxin oxidoreductase subunit beta [Rhodothermus profundi]